MAAAHCATVTVNGSTHTGEARASKKAAKAPPTRSSSARFRGSELAAVVVQRWRERCSTDVVDMIGRLGSSTDVPWRRPGASEKDRFVAIRDHLKRQRERCETDVASQRSPCGRGLVVSGRGPLGGAGRSSRATTAKFADARQPRGIVVRRNANGLLCVAVDRRGDDVVSSR